MKAKFLGSTVALILGALSFAGSIAQAARGDHGANPLGGTVIIIGALAYRSFKRRRLALVASTIWRQVIELLALALIVFLVVLQNDLKTRVANDPVPNVLLPLWVFIAYAALFFKPQVALLDRGPESNAGN